MRLGELIEQEQRERIITDEGLYGVNKPDPAFVLPDEIDADLLLAAIEQNIAARQCNVRDLASKQRLGEFAAKGGDAKQEAVYKQAAADVALRIEEIEGELARLGSRMAIQFGLKAATTTEEES